MRAKIEPFCTLSYGLLILNERDEVLLVQRKDSVEYIDLLRGRFHGDAEDLAFYMSRLTASEIHRLTTVDFDTLWDSLWVNHSSKSFSSEYLVCKKRFQRLAFPAVETAYTEPEFVIPRGRRKTSYESPIACAKRECTEETGIPASAYTVDPAHEFFEYYYGSNGVLYGTIYWIAKLHGGHPTYRYDACNMVQNSEVREMTFFHLRAAIHKVRPYRSAMRGILFDVKVQVTGKLW